MSPSPGNLNNDVGCLKTKKFYDQISLNSFFLNFTLTLCFVNKLFH